MLPIATFSPTSYNLLTMPKDLSLNTFFSCSNLSYLEKQFKELTPATL